MHYETQEEAQMRLGGTVVMFDGHPVVVNEVVSDAGVLFVKALVLPGAKNVVAFPVDDPLLEARSMPLGYVNYAGNALYISRKPVRKYKQGLNGDNIHIPMNDRGDRLATWTNLYRHMGFREMMENTYPTFEEALRLLGTVDDSTGRDIRQVAFKRHFAIEVGGLGIHYLHYRGAKVAWGQLDDFVLPSEYRHLMEVLKENGVKVNE